jgi:cysteine desulfurase/selenocysteine lyase
MNDHRYAFLDSAASSQMSDAVINTVADYYRTTHANVHRGIYRASVEATERFERARVRVQKFIGATRPEEIIFTSGTTDSVNLAAATWGEKFIESGDTILTTILEHHSNFVPWQQLAKRKGATIAFVEIDSDGQLNMQQFNDLIKKHEPKLVAVTAMSNALGTVTPIREMIGVAHAVGAKVFVDGAQSVPHFGANVSADGIDFLAFSGHKLGAPTGVGVLYARKDILESMPPYRYGGEMVLYVKRDGTTLKEVPHKFEAGTPNISGVIGLDAALGFLESIDLAGARLHERQLTAYALEKLQSLDGVKVYGARREGSNRGGVISFTVSGVHAHDVGTIVDTKGVAMRVGHHCAHPLMDSLGVPSTVRMSVYFYNDREDIDQAVDAVRYAGEYLHGGRR